jgi:hypothetical protein
MAQSTGSSVNKEKEVVCKFIWKRVTKKKWSLEELIKDGM